MFFRISIEYFEANQNLDDVIVIIFYKKGRKSRDRVLGMIVWLLDRKVIPAREERGK